MANAAPQIRKRPVRRRPRISVTVAPELLEEIDHYLEVKPELDRSAVVGEALQMWHAERLRSAIREEILSNREVIDPDEAADWRSIRKASWEMRAGKWT